jgi:hypothetical protein
MKEHSDATQLVDEWLVQVQSSPVVPCKDKAETRNSETNNIQSKGERGQTGAICLSKSTDNHPGSSVLLLEK